MNRLLLTLGILSLFSFNAQAANLFLLSNFDNAGDHNQALGIAKQLKDISQEGLPIEDLNTNRTTSSEIKETIEKALTRGKVIVVGAGEGGIEGIKDLSPNPNLIICLTSHMFLEPYKDPKLLEKVNYIALPTHDLKAESLGNKLIEVTGVPHNRQADVSDSVYQKWSQEIPACKTYVGVILGGDAPTPQKTLNRFATEDAKKLAGYVAHNFKDTCVLISNGPRTGKFKNQNEEDKTVHRKGYSDPITEFFKEELTRQGVKNLKVFDFQHGTPENKEFVLPFNSFDLIVGTLRVNDGHLLVPGESTSMISEAIDTMPSGKVQVYENGAMNEIHKAHIESEFKTSRVSVLRNYEAIESLKMASNRPIPSATQVIAQKLWEAVEK